MNKSSVHKGEMADKPEFGTEDYRRYAVLFNDVTYAPVFNRLLFSERCALADYLWAQGWRRDVRPEDVTERQTRPPLVNPAGASGGRHGGEPATTVSDAARSNHAIPPGQSTSDADA